MDKNKIVIATLGVALVIAIAIIICLLLPKDTKTVYTISFNTDGGSEVVSQQIEEGKIIAKPDDPSKEGYEFLGWYLNDKYFDFETEVEGNLTLDARWKEIVVEDNKDEDKENKEDEVAKYTVTFNSDGGSSVAKQIVEDGKKVTEPKAPTKKGYTFKGWYLGNTKYNFSNEVTKDITLKAKWDKVQEEKPNTQPEVTVKKYTVTFDANGGTSVAKQTIEEGKTATSKKTTRTGYTFQGWMLNGEKFDFSTPITSNITLKAEWKKNDVVKVDIVKDESSSTGQYIIYVLLNGERVAGTVDITNSKGVTKTVDIPAKGLSRPEGSFKTVTNPKVK